MKIFSIYIINKSGGLIYNLDNLDTANNSEIESCSKTIHNDEVEIPLKFKIFDERLIVDFGTWGAGIEPGISVTEYNNSYVWAGRTKISNNHDTQEIDVLDVIKKHQQRKLPVEYYPFKLTFEKPTKTSNEKIVIASIFHAIYAISSQLSPDRNYDQFSGISLLETDDCHLHCFQSPTGTKFLCVTEPIVNSSNTIQPFLKKAYQVYADFALKDPFYTIEMPIKSAKFEKQIRNSIEQLK